MAARSFQLRVDADASLALSVRVFVAESARRLGAAEPDVEDLRLLATELLANAVETGQQTFSLDLSIAGEGWLLRAEGVGELVAGGAGPIDRRDVIRGLADLRVVEDGAIELRPISPAF